MRSQKALAAPSLSFLSFAVKAPDNRIIVRGATNNKQQTTNNKQQTTNNKQQTTNNKQQTTNNKQQTTNNLNAFRVQNNSFYFQNYNTITSFTTNAQGISLCAFVCLCSGFNTGRLTSLRCTVIASIKTACSRLIPKGTDFWVILILIANAICKRSIL